MNYTSRIYSGAVVCWWGKSWLVAGVDREDPDFYSLRRRASELSHEAIWARAFRPELERQNPTIERTFLP